MSGVEEAALLAMLAGGAEGGGAVAGPALGATGVFGEAVGAGAGTGAGKGAGLGSMLGALPWGTILKRLNPSVKVGPAQPPGEPPVVPPPALPTGAGPAVHPTALAALSRLGQSGPKLTTGGGQDPRALLLRLLMGRR